LRGDCVRVGAGLATSRLDVFPLLVEPFANQADLVLRLRRQIAQAVLGAVSEADRHNLRGEKISVDTIPLVGEENLAAAVRAVADLDRARALLLAGSIMGGDITKAVVEIQQLGFPVIALNMVGSVTDVADLVVTDPVQAGTMAVMGIADTAKFDFARQKGRRY